MTRAELIAALEKADGPSVELDKRVFALVNGREWCQPLFEIHELSEPLPEFTSSIDAALPLVPGGFLWGVGTIRFGDDQGRRAYAANCRREGYIGPETPIVGALGETPAIALCIAALRAGGEK